MNEIKFEGQAKNTMIVLKNQELIQVLSTAMNAFFDRNKDLDIVEVSEIQVTATAHIFNMSILERVKPEMRELVFEQCRAVFFGVPKQDDVAEGEVVSDV